MKNKIISEDKIEVRKTEKGKDETLKNKLNEPSGARKRFLFFLATLVFVGVVFALVFFELFSYLAGLGFLILLTFVYLSVRKRLKKYDDIKKMEIAFPDFIALMASNLRAGMTVDRALLLSSRKEFAPLDKEITLLGKDIITGKEINAALSDMSDRVKSDEIKKTVMLIISGIRSGGNLSILLEQVSLNMRERMFVKKRASSNVLMYVIFIFFASAFGAPVLFGLSSVLVEVLVGIIGGLPSGQTTSVKLPFSFTEISISPTFVFYFALVFMVFSNIFSALMLGLVNKGKEREGLKFIVPMIAISIVVFFVARLVVLSYFPDFLG